MTPVTTAIHSAGWVVRTPSRKRRSSSSGTGHRIRPDELGDEDRLAAGREALAHLLAQHLEDALMVAEHLRAEVIGGDQESRVPIEPVDEVLDAGNEFLVQGIETDFNRDIHRTYLAPGSEVYRSGE